MSWTVLEVSGTRVLPLTSDRYMALATLFLVIANTFLTYYAHNFAMVLMGTSIQTMLAGFLGAVSREHKLLSA